MKKSDYERLRAEEHFKFTDRTPIIERLVAADVRAAEAAGVVWELEQSRLPARVQLTRTDDDVTQYVIDVLGRAYAVAAIPISWVRHHEERIAVLRAMVETYNLWGPCGLAKEELQKACNQYYGSVSALQHAIGRLIRDAETKERSGC